jgi:anti-anti-sigma factor
VSHIHCPRCGLRVRVRVSYLTLEHCPRCLARHHVIEKMILSRSGPPTGPERLQLHVWTEPDLIRIVLHGELDLVSRRRLDAELGRILALGFPRIVVDLSGLDAIDASGVRTLLRARRRARTRGGELWLRPGPPPVQRMLALSASALRFEPPSGDAPWPSAAGAAPEPVG